MTFAQWEEESAERAFDFLEHLEEYPPDYVILAAVHLKPKPKTLTATDADKQRSELQAMFGQAAPLPIPQELRDLVQWADELGKKELHAG